MRFRDQIAWMALVGLGSFGLGMVVWMASQAGRVASDSWLITIAWALVVGGLYLLVVTLSRPAAKRQQLKFQRNRWTHPTATVGPLNRWFYWVDRNGKDRDA